VSFLGPCCPAPLYCIAVHDCLMLIEQINDDDESWPSWLQLFTLLTTYYRCKPQAGMKL